jgi:hypothetical protein
MKNSNKLALAFGVLSALLVIASVIILASIG